MADTETLTSTRSEARRPPPTPRPALVIAWCRGAPERVGEVLHPPRRGAGILGRGAEAPASGLPRMLPERSRPGRAEAGRPLDSKRLSRDQLEVRADGGALSLVSLGRRPLIVRGAAVERARLSPGETAVIEGELVLLCDLRAPQLPPTELQLHPFGQADAFGIVGETPAAWALRRRVAFLAPRAAHVLVTGASGTGKELAARALQALSARAGGPFITRNAATIPEGLVDAELFGNMRDYPNPGMAERPGLFGAADGGALFLDEIAELSEAAQAHLLRALDRGEYTRLGEEEPRRADVRLIAATNRPVDALKHDLAARLPLRLALPGLGERLADVPLVAAHIARRIFAGDPQLAARFAEDGAPRFSPDLITLLLAHPWTTHARELEGLLWRALGESEGDTIEAPPSSAATTVSHTSDTDRLETAADWRAYVGRPPAEIPPEAVQAALDAVNGVQEKAWKLLGLESRYVLRRLITRYGLEVRRKG